MAEKITQSYVITEDLREIIAKKAVEMGGSVEDKVSESAAIRAIIREWAKLTSEQRIRLTEAGRQALAQSQPEQ